MPAPAPSPAPNEGLMAFIEIVDHFAPTAGAPLYSELVDRVTELEDVCARRFGQVVELARALTAVARDIQNNTDASLDEALERATLGARRGAGFLTQEDVRSVLSDPPVNVRFFAEHRRLRTEPEAF